MKQNHEFVQASSTNKEMNLLQALTAGEQTNIFGDEAARVLLTAKMQETSLLHVFLVTHNKQIWC